MDGPVSWEVGGEKTGDNRFYDRMIPIADELQDVHLKDLTQEALIAAMGGELHITAALPDRSVEIGNFATP
jgi:hypothetical protein